MLKKISGFFKSVGVRASMVLIFLILIAIFLGQFIAPPAEKKIDQRQIVANSQPQKKKTDPLKKAAKVPKTEEPKKAAKTPKAEEPKKAAKTPKAEEPKKAAKPPKAEESKKAAKPPKAEEPKKAAKPPKAEEPKKAAKPPKAEEPKKVEEPKKAAKKSEDIEKAQKEFLEHVQSAKTVVEEKKETQKAEVSKIEQSIEEKKKTNTALVEKINQARKIKTVPEVKETLPSKEIVKTLEEMVREAENEKKKATADREKKEVEWDLFLNKVSKSNTPEKKPKISTEELSRFFKDLTHPTEKTAIAPANKLLKAYDHEKKAAETVKKTQEFAENRLTPAPPIKKNQAPAKNITPAKATEKAYRKAFRGLMSLGDKKTDKPQVKWAIFNDPGKGLKEVYPLFNMEPHIRHNGKYYRLDTGSPANSMVISSFGKTGILCGDPWRDFKKELSTLERSLGTDLTTPEIIYLMDEHILFYFYSKVNQALEFAINKGLIERSEINRSQVRVSGRVLAVTSAGGNKRFGLYLPDQIECFDLVQKKVRDIPINPRECFAQDPDIRPLMEEGIL